MNNKAIVNWKKGMAFDAEINSHHIIMDSSKEHGGEDKGARPKPLLLAAIGGCSGMDVISILEKMKIVPDEFLIDIESHITEDHPKIYDEIHLIYKFKGANLSHQLAQIEKAVKLSMERYCGVSAMLGKAAKITYSVEIED